MSTLGFVSGMVYLFSATLFVVGLHLMRAPSTARRGNQISAAGMVAGVATTTVYAVVEYGGNAWGWIALLVGLLAGGAWGAFRARTVQMTDMPQLVSVFNAVGGGAAVGVAFAAFLRFPVNVNPDLNTSIPVVLDVLIGSVTFSGSLVAAGKLQGLIPGRPLTFPGSRAVNVVVVVVAVVVGVLVLMSQGSTALLLLVLVAALVFGILMVLPIGGADAPVVVSLLNALTGLAVAMAGFAINNQVMIIAGALVGAAGTILTLQMAQAMNRSVAAIILGGFGAGDTTSAAPSGDDLAHVRTVTADDLAIELAYAQRVMIVPGYGLAAAQAQHEPADLAKILTDHGIDVKYAIHPVAGRMPGHMNVLLAEASVPYTQMLEIDAANAPRSPPATSPWWWVRTTSPTRWPASPAMPYRGCRFSTWTTRSPSWSSNDP